MHRRSPSVGSSGLKNNRFRGIGRGPRQASQGGEGGGPRHLCNLSQLQGNLRDLPRLQGSNLRDLPRLQGHRLECAAVDADEAVDALHGWFLL